MIVIAIIGILAAIAIPQFGAYRNRSHNSAAQADLRNAATAQEAYFADHERYCNDTTTLTAGNYGLFRSRNVTLQISLADTTGYQMEAWHSAGDKSYRVTGPGGTIADY